MAENPLAIRVGEDVKSKFNELAESGDFANKGDFLNRLLELYQTGAMNTEVSMIRPAIEAVETLASRTLKVLAGTAAAILTQEEKQKQELDETKARLQRRIDTLEQGRTEDAERVAAIAAEKEAAEGKAAALMRRIGELENALSDKTALVDEYKEKLDKFSAVVGYEDRVAKLISQLEERLA